jgi:SH3-like domain-containing protein
VKSLPKSMVRVVVVAAITLSLSACKHSGGRVLEIAYVSGVEVNLRDRVAAVFEKAGLVRNGDRVEVLEHDRRFVKVRTASGQMGWMEQRYLVSQQVFDELQKLTAENAHDPVQAQGITRNGTNLHVEPGRETEHLYQILAGEKLELLKRGTADKNAPAPVSTVAAQKPPVRTAAESAHANPKPGEKPNEKAAQKNESTSAPSTPAQVTPATPTPAPIPAIPPHPSTGPAPLIEDWWLVRDSHGRVGWVLARMVDVDVPLDVAQYAEGQRIMALFTLDEVQDGDKKVPQYLMVLTEPKDGLPFDFNQFRVFTWNVRRHRYETAYRERIEGMLPVTLAHEDFGKEGVLPVFMIRALNEDGKTSERKYKLNNPMVRRVLAPGEEPTKPLRKGNRKDSRKSPVKGHRRAR